MTNHHHPDGRRRPHQDWRIWVGVVAMLAAIAIYVLTLDDSLLR
jgi:hypothetical protein